jgi:hypothetical protein
MRVQIREKVGAKGKLSVYIVKVSFSKIEAFKGTIKKFLNVGFHHILI